MAVSRLLPKASVTLSDNDASVTANLACSVALNDFSRAAHPPQVRELDFGQLRTGGAVGDGDGSAPPSWLHAYDVLLGADIVYKADDADARALGHTIAALLKPARPEHDGGVDHPTWQPHAILVTREGRLGVSAFVQGCKEAKLACLQEAVDSECTMMTRLRAAHPEFGSEASHAGGLCFYFVSRRPAPVASG